MRYAQMLRQHQTNLPVPSLSSAPRKFRPISKRANTFALDVRNSLSTGRGTALGILLLATPFIVTFFSLLTGSRSSGRSRRDHHNSSDLRYRLQYNDLNKSSIRNPNPVQLLQNAKPVKLPAFLKQLSKERRNGNQKNSVTLLAACQKWPGSLTMSYPSWSSQTGINQIVLVEWSREPFDWHTIPRLSDDLHTRRLTVVLTNGAGSWALSRAYNLAAKFAVGQYILKVDCDTHLLDGFFDKHSKPSINEYYTVTWGTPRDDNEDHLRGVWFGHLSNFLKVGGYDERLVSYGYEDVDFYNRLNAAGLTAKSIDLDVIRHNIGPDLVYKHENHFIVSRRVSIRTNEELLKALPAWRDVHATQGNGYIYAFEKTLRIVIANLTHSAPDAYHSKSEDDQRKLLSTVLQTGLHDDFGLPWDIIQNLEFDDLDRLAHFLDTDKKPHIIVALLEGPDTLSNVFNLVSAVQLAMTFGRPTIVVWTPPGGAKITGAKGPLLKELFDLSAINEQVNNTAKSEGMRKYLAYGASADHALVLAADKWCDEGMESCAQKYDSAYGPFTELTTRMARVYDEQEPVPISTSRHTVVRLGSKTKVGNPETRSYAFKTLVPSAPVRKAQLLIGGQAKLGVVAESVEATEEVVTAVKSEHKDIVESGSNSLLPIVGPGHIEVRKALFGDKDHGKFCEGVECSVSQMAVEVASVFGAIEAAHVFPQDDIKGEREAWVKRSDVSNMMLHDLRAARKG